MKSLVLVVHDVPRFLPESFRQGSQVVEVHVTVQTGQEYRYTRVWHLGEIEARVVEQTPVIDLEAR